MRGFARFAARRCNFVADGKPVASDSNSSDHFGSFAARLAGTYSHADGLVNRVTEGCMMATGLLPEQV